MRLQSKLMVSCFTLVLLVALGGLINTQTHQRVTDDFDRLMDTDVPGLLALEHAKAASLRMLEKTISYVFLRLKANEALEEEAAQIEKDVEKEKEEFREARNKLHQWLAECCDLSNNERTSDRLQYLWKLENRLYEAALNLMNVGAAVGRQQAQLQARDVLEGLEDEFLTLIDRVIQAKLKKFASSRERVKRSAASTRQLNMALFGVSLVGVLFLGFLLSKMVVQPLLKLKEAVQAIGAGRLDTSVSIQSQDEIGKLAGAFNEMVAEVRHSRTALEKARDELERRVQQRTTELTSTNQALQVTVGELHDVQAMLQERVERLHTLMHLNQVMSLFLDREEALIEIARAAARLMDVPAVAFWLADETTQTVELSAFSNGVIGAEIPVSRFDFAQGMVGWVAAHRQALNVADVFEDDRVKGVNWWRAHQLVSFLALPVMYDDRLLAVLTLFGHEPFAFGEDEQALMSSFAAQAAVTIRNADLYTTVTQARDAAEAATRAKSAFLANMSHELRTPLHIIQSCASLGLKKMDPSSLSNLEEYLQKIIQGSTTLLTLVNDLLDLAKLEAGKMEFEFQNTDLGRLVSTVADEFSALMTVRQLSVRFSRSEHDVMVYLEPERIKQVVRNLISNAVKFSPANATIDLSLEEKPQTLVVRVRDYGPGIPEAELETIFDKFVQSSYTQTGAGGTGLGLSICREIIGAHEGELWVENAPDGGAIFAFSLPLWVG